MRYTFQCPKCQSREVVEIIGSTVLQNQKIPINKWGFQNAILDRYICVNCGFTEEYVQLTDSFKKNAHRLLDAQDRKFDDFV